LHAQAVNYSQCYGQKWHSLEFSLMPESFLTNNTVAHPPESLRSLPSYRMI
jgi:hypothetical protein